MYEVTRPARGNRPEERRTFHTAAGLLRWALRERVFRHNVGGVPYPTRFDEIHLGYKDHDKGYDYHLIDSFVGWKITGDHLAAMRRAQRAYAERLHYRREIAPEWKPDMSVSPTGEVHYADNSVELHEVNRDGEKRRRTVVAPHGDACF